MAANVELKIKVSVAWWVWVYIDALLIFCKVFDTEPDMDKVERIILRGFKLERMQ